MAIQPLSIISLILRPYVEQPISADGWKTLFAQVDPHRNFDGELMAFGTMSGQDMDRIIENDTIYWN
jgi:3-deoxy-D-arabino-heptulosonate 7-phosphate (DAHP) synthase